MSGGLQAGGSDREPGDTEFEGPGETEFEGPGGTVFEGQGETVFEGAGAGFRVRLPGELAERFEPVEQLDGGGQADLLVVAPRGGGEQAVLKLYRSPSIQLDAGLIERLRDDAELDHVVDILDYGQVGGCWWELLEHVRGGSLGELMAQEGPRLDPELLRVILEELGGAVAHLHELGLAHNDISPDNVLVRERAPTLDLVLADFGIATITRQTLRFTRSTGRSTLYAAPEAFSKGVGPSRDWWAVGMILLEAASGQHPFEGLTDNQILYQLSVLPDPVDVSEVGDERWELLCRGLLTKHPDYRWRAEQVAAWLDGDTPEVHEAAPPPPVARPFVLAGESYPTPTALATGLAGHWEQGIKELARDHIYQWVVGQVGDYTLASFIKDLDESGQPWDLQLLRLICHLDPALPPTYKGYDLSPVGLAGLSAEVVRAPSGQAAEVLGEIFDEEILSVYADATDTPDLKDLDTNWRRDVRAVRDLSGQLPADARLTDQATAAARAWLLHCHTSPDGEGKLRDQARQAITPDARECGWFTRLGDPDTAPPANLTLLAATAHHAATTTRTNKAAEEQRRIERRRQAWERWRVWLRKFAPRGALIGLVGLVVLFVFNRGDSLEPSQGPATTPSQTESRPETPLPEAAEVTPLPEADGVTSPPEEESEDEATPPPELEQVWIDAWRQPDWGHTTCPQGELGVNGLCPGDEVTATFGFQLSHDGPAAHNVTLEIVVPDDFLLLREESDVFELGTVDTEAEVTFTLVAYEDSDPAGLPPECGAFSFGGNCTHLYERDAYLYGHLPVEFIVRGDNLDEAQYTAEITVAVLADGS